MEKSRKCYRLNQDFDIICETMVVKGIKSYSIDVEMSSLPFLFTLESYSGLKSPEEANNLFKGLCQKYKEGLRYL